MTMTIMKQWLSGILLLHIANGFQLQQHGPSNRVASSSSSNSRLYDQETPSSSSSSSSSSTRVERYSYKDWDLTYRYKEAQGANSKKQRGWSFLQQPTKKTAPPLVLVHPVGIGLDSWFWDKIMDVKDNDFEMYAPDLIGCGTLHGGDAWDLAVKPLSFPLGWAQGVEALLQQSSSRNGGGGTTLVCQGGLAPVAVVLAARNPDLISRLVLTSPPTYEDMVTAIPEGELKRNYDFLTNPLSARIAFGLLESEWALRFFSNAFLFAKPCDDAWIDNALKTISPAQRFPVAAFNAGLCNHRSFVDELTSQITQPTLILTGLDDKRDRQGYVDNMINCQWQQLEGCNVLPWENPAGVCGAVQDFISSSS